MKRLNVVLALVPVLLLAGCLGGLGPETGPADSIDVSPEQVPGVTNGTLSNASALIEANREAVTADGAILHVNQSSGEMDIAARLAIGANLSTFSLSGTGTGTDAQTTSIDQWSNETTQFVRTTSAGDTNYRVLDGHDDRLTVLSPAEEFLSAGDFEVANETAGEGHVVLTADSVSATSASFGDAQSFNGRLVVTESGQIRNLSVTAVRDSETVTYSYELREASVESVPKPDWVAEVPPGATVQAQLSIDVENDSYLALTHSGGDEVPSATTVRVESNGSADEARLAGSLSAGETRYVYFDASSQALRVTAERPGQDTVSPVTSPVSVQIVTEDGATLYSASMGWGSESASESGTGSGTSETAESTTGSASGSATSAETTATATPA